MTPKDKLLWLAVNANEKFDNVECFVGVNEWLIVDGRESISWLLKHDLRLSAAEMLLRNPGYKVNNWVGRDWVARIDPKIEKFVDGWLLRKVEEKNCWNCGKNEDGCCLDETLVCCSNYSKWTPKQEAPADKNGLPEAKTNVGVMLCKGTHSTYRPSAGTICLISPPNSDDDKGYVFQEYEILWKDKTFVLYRQKNCWPNLEKWEHILAKPLTTKPVESKPVTVKSWVRWPRLTQSKIQYAVQKRIDDQVYFNDAWHYKDEIIKQGCEHSDTPDIEESWQKIGGNQ